MKGGVSWLVVAAVAVCVLCSSVCVGDVPFKYPLYKQCDPRWGGDIIESTTVCKVGCLMSSVSMALAGKNITIPPGSQVSSFLCAGLCFFLSPFWLFGFRLSPSLPALGSAPRALCECVCVCVTCFFHCLRSVCETCFWLPSLHDDFLLVALCGQCPKKSHTRLL